MKLSVSAYRAHASAHKKILDTAYQLNYGSTSASSTTTAGATIGHHQYKVEPLANDEATTPLTSHLTTNQNAENSGSDTPVNSPRSPLNTSREEDDESSNAASSECKSPNQRYGASSPGGTKSNQRWMKLRTTVQISSAIQKPEKKFQKPPLKREDSFLKRFSTRQLPDQQETIDDTNSESNAPGSQNHAAPRRRRRLQKSPKTVVNPDENFYFYWLLTLTICILYNMWTLIVRQSFPELQTLISTFWYICDGISDIVFLLDVGVQLRTGYLEQGLMVYDSKKLASHYLSSRAFLLDLGALCPLDLLQVRFGPQPMLRFPRFLKVYRAVNYYYMVESRTVWPNLWRVVNLIHILLILAHWFGCFYFLLSEAEGFQGDWVYPYRPGDYATLTRKYLGSLYWSTLTLTTIGDLPTPETNAERTVTVDGPRSLPRRGLKSRLLQFNTNGGYIFTIVSYLIGVFIFATIVGQVGNVITNRNANRLEFERLLDGAKTYMRHHKVPGGMKKRVLRWYDYSWSRGRIQGGGDINTALGLLPDKLKTELALHVNLSVLKKVTIFQECQPEFLHDLVLKMKAYIFTPGDSICRKGEVAREMFIIADGILEVLSETGRVLTSMKAGDFFGEIGILNLDGLNKRTADVRSVGYSELFSLSREDVLAAMKDYPEAQEILQALGRKRLMEVRNSARQNHRPSSKHHPRGPGAPHDPQEVVPPPPTSRNLVHKIKTEAKGLRNALRKSRVYRQKSDESVELQPLHTPSKGVLKRMPRVRSDEMSQEDPDPGGGVALSGPGAALTGPGAVSGAPAGVTSPLGAGLPLLSRLRLLKEKQDNEERQTHQTSCLQSPPVVPEVEEPPREVIGAGLPLLQRLLLLKAKEDKMAAASSSILSVNVRDESPMVSPKPNTGKVSFRDRIFPVQHHQPQPQPQIQVQASSSERSEEVPAASTPDVIKDTRDSRIEPEIDQTSKMLTPINNSSSSSNDTQNQLKLPCVVGFVQKVPHIVPQIPHIVPQIPQIQKNILRCDSEACASSTSVDSDVCDASDASDPWSKLKQAAIGRDQLQLQQPPSPPSNIPTHRAQSDSVVNSAASRRTKPKLLQLQTKTKARTKHYESIDDLSPEYGGLPFVKKLKILNERQKLAELERAIHTRSVSLDIPENAAPYDDQVLTRSQSEASAMHRRNAASSGRLAQNEIPVSPNEANETPERRNLKSILKKLSEDVRTEQPVGEDERWRRRQLLRAQTIEGYAARHSKLSKSVTFNRETLQSPPGSSAALATSFSSHSLTTTFTLTTSTTTETPTSIPTPTTIVVDATTQPQDQGVQTGGPTFSTGVQTEYNGVVHPPDLSPLVERNEDDTGATPDKNAKTIKSPADEHEYFGEALLAIKHVISAHLQEMQQKFQQRFDKLEHEVRSRDLLICQLRQHINELERSYDDSYTGSDSLSTVISRLDRHSWDDPSNQESLELQDLPESIRPHRAWSPERRPFNSDTVIELDSATATDTDSELGDDDAPHTNTSHQGQHPNQEQDQDQDQDPEQDNIHGLTHSNWEFEMLAAQMRQQRRSHSFDHTAHAHGLLRQHSVQGGARGTQARRRLLCRGYSADTGGRD